MTKKKQENCLKRWKYLSRKKCLAILISVWYNRKRKEVKKVTAKDRYNKKNYDTILLRVPIGEKDKIKKKAEKDGISINAYIKRRIEVT